MASEFDCAICLEPLPRDDRVPLEPCGHSQFHASCLVRAMRQNPACPLCRSVPEAEEETEEEEEDDGLAIGVQFTHIPTPYRAQFEGLLEDVVSHVTQELDQQTTAHAEQLLAARRNRVARRDADVRRARDAFWEARERRRAAERALADGNRPLDREVRQLLAKHRSETRAFRAEVARATRAEGEAREGFHAAADRATGR